MPKAVGPTDDSIEATRLSGAPVFVEKLFSLYIMLWVCPSICHVRIGRRDDPLVCLRGLAPREALITSIGSNA